VGRASFFPRPNQTLLSTAANYCGVGIIYVGNTCFPSTQVYTLLSLGYIHAMWHLRHNFFIALRYVPTRRCLSFQNRMVDIHAGVGFSQPHATTVFKRGAVVMPRSHGVTPFSWSQSAVLFNVSKYLCMSFPTNTGAHFHNTLARVPTRKQKVAVVGMCMRALPLSSRSIHHMRVRDRMGW